MTKKPISALRRSTVPITNKTLAINFFIGSEQFISNRILLDDNTFQHYKLIIFLNSVLRT